MISKIKDTTFHTSELFPQENFEVNDWTRIAITILLSGYMKENNPQVYLNEPSKFEKKLSLLNKFGSFVLSYPPHIKFKYDVNLQIKHQKFKSNNSYRKHKNVLLFSGGLDSTACALYLKENRKKEDLLLLWIDYGQPYSEVEQKKTTEISKIIGLELKTIKINLRNLIDSNMNEWGHIIPARNFMLVAFANQFVDSNGNIYLCGHNEESYVADKSPEFYKKCSDFLELNVCSPISNINKSEIISYWKLNWINEISPEDTISCYDNTGYCGKCKACFKKKVAFEAAQLDNNIFFDTDFFENQLMSYLNDRFNELPINRKLDLMICAERLKDYLSNKNLIVINNISQNYKFQIKERKDFLNQNNENLFSI